MRLAGLLFCFVYILRDAVSVGFFIVPPEVHGRWKVEGDHQGSFEVDSHTVTASFKTAILQLSIQNCVENDTFHFHEMKVIRRPSPWDMKQIWKGISYFQAVREYGIWIQLIEGTEHTLRVRYTIHEKKDGYLVLIRNDDTTASEQKLC